MTNPSTTSTATDSLNGTARAPSSSTRATWVQTWLVLAGTTAAWAVVIAFWHFAGARVRLPPWQVALLSGALLGWLSALPAHHWSWHLVLMLIIGSAGTSLTGDYYHLRHELLAAANSANQAASDAQLQAFLLAQKAGSFPAPPASKNGDNDQTNGDDKASTNSDDKAEPLESPHFTPPPHFTPASRVTWSHYFVWTQFRRSLFDHPLEPCMGWIIATLAAIQAARMTISRAPSRSDG